MKYGLPYKGSKNRLAEHIVRLMPKADHLIDLFCGGCAVSHAAMLAGKYKHIHINDCDWRPVTLFMDVLAGRYQDDNRWISREQFLQLKDTDPYVAIVWSFGNNMRDYLYSREIEPLKRAIHYAIFYDDYKPAAELGHELTFIDQLTDTRQKYIAVKRYFEQYGHFQQQSFEGGQSYTNRLEHYERSVCKASNRGGVQLLSQTARRVPAHREPTLHTTDCSTESGTMRCLTIRGGGKISLRVFRTMPMWLSQKAA